VPVAKFFFDRKFQSKTGPGSCMRLSLRHSCWCMPSSLSTMRDVPAFVFGRLLIIGKSRVGSRTGCYGPTIRVLCRRPLACEHKMSTNPPVPTHEKYTMCPLIKLYICILYTAIAVWIFDMQQKTVEWESCSQSEQVLLDDKISSRWELQSPKIDKSC
jgi:hypothetical protein